MSSFVKDAPARRLRPLVAFATLAALLVFAAASNDASAAPAPPLQLPWPPGVANNINGGTTYGCGPYHVGASHYAIDFTLYYEPVTAVAAGKVSTVPGDPGLGNYAVIDHGDGYTSIYGHLSSFTVKNGSRVLQGQIIGISGETGIAFGAHLHFLMRYNGQAYRPEPMSRQQGFGYFGFSSESGLGCGSGDHDPSPSWTAQRPTAPIDGSLIQASRAEGIYVVDAGKKRLVVEDIFQACGYRRNDITSVSQGALDAMTVGEPVSQLPCPFTLVRYGGVVFTIENGVKRPLASVTDFNNCGYDSNQIVEVTLEEVESLPAGPILKALPCTYVRTPGYHKALIEGALIQGSGATVAILEGGKKRSLTSEAVFNACIYRWTDIITVSEGAFSDPDLAWGPAVTAGACPHVVARSSVGTLYVISKGTKRPIESMAVFNACGYILGDILSVNDSALSTLPTGPILARLPCPFTRQ